MLEEFKNIKATKKNQRSFGLSVGFVCVLIAGYLFWKERETFPYFLTIGLILIFCGGAMPSVLKPFYLAWMGIAVVLGWIMTRLILSLLFYLVITPIALGSKLIGKQFIDLKWDAGQPSYWIETPLKEPTREGYEKQF